MFQHSRGAKRKEFGTKWHIKEGAISRTNICTSMRDRKFTPHRSTSLETVNDCPRLTIQTVDPSSYTGFEISRRKCTCRSWSDNRRKTSTRVMVSELGVARGDIESASCINCGRAN